MSPSNKRRLTVAGFVFLIGLCVAAFFFGKHAGSRKAELPAPPSASPSPSASLSASTSLSVSPRASASPPSSTAQPSTAQPSTAQPSTAPSSTPPAASITIPVRTSVALSTPGESPAVLVPTSCTISSGVATASGTFNPDFYGESYVRAGDVVELYVYSGLGSVSPNGTQLADLGSEHPVPVGRTGPWQVTVPLDPELGLVAAQCLVAIQSTHAFMGAGNAGG